MSRTTVHGPSGLFVYSAVVSLRLLALSADYKLYKSDGTIFAAEKTIIEAEKFIRYWSVKITHDWDPYIRVSDVIEIPVSSGSGLSVYRVYEDGVLVLQRLGKSNAPKKDQFDELREPLLKSATEKAENVRKSVIIPLRECVELWFKSLTTLTGKAHPAPQYKVCTGIWMTKSCFSYNYGEIYPTSIWHTE
ncbi:hypothetical protein [Nitrosomonas oligotropha]|uniref:Uncharacterized protein n=1 Tax=Nitrosomonas oligotropha TaxID=42354 RepID=A0A1H8VLC7_9PROT|nr:hypothetical protein [Nitrosomonas oligotropha]SDX61909.1 hypothetical protein SAMN05216300_1641 [Nitrosomonas oligotropha]SEP16189.1 hypothetical protein SAMN05216333_1651 [Nitrosomonas oligotropha]